MNYTNVNTIVNTNIFTVVITVVLYVVWMVVLCVFNLIFLICAYKIWAVYLIRKGIFYVKKITCLCIGVDFCFASAC